MFKKGLVSTVIVAICSFNCYAEQIESSWVEGTWLNQYWENNNNWSTLSYPHNDRPLDPTTYAVTISGNDIDVPIFESHSIDRLDCYGEIFLFGAGGTKQTLTFDASIPPDYIGDLYNHGDLDITNLFIDGDVDNLTGAFLELDDSEIFADLYNQINATIEVYGYVEADGIDNNGTIISTLGAHLCVEDGNFINSGRIELYGSQCGVEDGYSFDNNSGAAITGWGILYSEGPFNNNGSIKAQAGVLRIRCWHTGLTNNGLLSADSSSSLQIKPAGDVNNLAMINTTAGDFIVDANLINSSGATIQILDGTLAAKKITQKSGAAFNAFGKIVAENGFYIETGATATITGPTNILGDVTISAGATLQISDGQTLITGQTVNNGTIELIGGTVIFQGGYSGGGTIPVTAGTDRNHFDVNSDGIEDFKDFASFAESWLWQASWY